MSGAYVFEIGGTRYRFEVAELKRARFRFFDRIGCADRVSNLFMARVLGYNLEYGIEFQEIVQEVQALEGLRQSATKPPTAFRNLPLRGLMHKHFTSARFLATNMLAQLGRNGLREILED